MDPYRIAQLLSEDIRVNNGFLFEALDAGIKSYISKLYKPNDRYPMSIYEIQTELVKIKKSANPREIAEELKSLIIKSILEKRRSQNRRDPEPGTQEYDQLLRTVKDILLKNEINRLKLLSSIGYYQNAIPADAFEAFKADVMAQKTDAKAKDLAILLKEWPFKEYTSQRMYGVGGTVEEIVRENVRRGVRVENDEFTVTASLPMVRSPGDWSTHRVIGPTFKAVRFGVFMKVEFGKGYSVEWMNKDLDELANRKVGPYDSFAFMHNKYEHKVIPIRVKHSPILKKQKAVKEDINWDPSMRSWDPRLDPILNTPSIIFIYANWLIDTYKLRTKVRVGIPDKPFEFLFNAVGDTSTLMQDQQQQPLEFAYKLVRKLSEGDKKESNETALKNLTLQNMFPDLPKLKCSECEENRIAYEVDGSFKCIRCTFGKKMPGEEGKKIEKPDGSTESGPRGGAGSDQQVLGSVPVNTPTVNSIQRQKAEKIEGLLDEVTEAMNGNIALGVSLELAPDEIERLNVDGRVIKFTEGPQANNSYAIKSTKKSYYNDHVVLFLILAVKIWKFGESDTDEATPPNDNDKFVIV